jgi:hypothetical protein
MCTMLSPHMRDDITAFTDHQKQTLRRQAAVACALRGE